MRFSNRSSFGAGAPNRLALLLEKKRASGAALADLTESNPTRCAFRSLHPELLESLRDPANLLYEPDPRGLLSAREAVCAHYAGRGIRLSPERVFLTSGTSEAYSFLFHLLGDPGGEVWCESPGYPLFDQLAAFAGMRLRRFRRGESPRLGENARALFVVNPNNPTGRYVPAGEWRAFETLSVPVVSDEVFFDFDWQDKPRISAASRAESLHFTLSGVSKMLGLPQMKLAWIAVTGPETLCREAAARLETVADAFLSVNTPSQRALSSWLKNKDAFVAEVLERVKTNFAALEGAGLAPVRPEGGWVAVLPLPAGVSDEEAALAVLEKQDVLVHPGYFFDFEEDVLVVSLLPERGRFAEALGRLSRGLAAC